MKKTININNTIISKIDGELQITEKQKFDYLFKPESRLYYKVSNTYYE